jgi:hypothetical protein
MGRRRRSLVVSWLLVLWQLHSLAAAVVAFTVNPSTTSSFASPTTMMVLRQPSSSSSQQSTASVQSKDFTSGRTTTTTNNNNSNNNHNDAIAMEPIEDSFSYLVQTSSNAYVQFAKDYPFVNNVGLASIKTAAADLIAQTVISGAPWTEVDLQRSLLFFLFGGVYSGGFQYLYQVKVFRRLFDVDKFTEQSWSDKLQDTQGLKALAAQTILDLAVLTAVYLPAFYIFKASVFQGTASEPSLWLSTGWDTYLHNFSKDEVDLLKVWLPADCICFSVPLFLRLPVRHVVSFAWTAYLSFARGGH